jgi:aspartate aminotransferase
MLSRLIKRVEPSPTLAATARAQALKAEGRDVCGFTVGEPDFDTPQHVKDAAFDAIRRGFTKYTAVAGIPPLREAIAAKLKRDQNLDYKPSEVVVTNGGKHALAAIMAVLLDPGDEVLIPVPYWTSYPDMARLVGGEPVFVHTTPRSGYVMSAEDLERALTPRTKIIMLNIPSNPTGACYSRVQLEALAAVIRAHPNRERLTILCDEVYECFVYDNFPYFSFLQVAPDLRRQVVIVNAFSKAYAMTGWRVGYAAGPREIIEAVITHQSQFTSNVCSIAQHAAAAAYRDNYAFPKMMAEEFTKRREIVCSAIAEMPGLSLPVKPLGAFYAFIRLEGVFGRSAQGMRIDSGESFANYLLEKFDTVVVQGEAFGDAGAIRLSYALSTAELTKGLARITEAVRALR